MKKRFRINLDLDLPNGKTLKDLIVNMRDFDTISDLGEGLFGKVSLVRDHKTGKKYASKKLKTQEQEGILEEMFKMEVEIMAIFDFYALLGLRGFTEPKKDLQPHILTEYCENGVLTNIIQLESKSMSPVNYGDTQKFIIAYGIARGMKVLHEEKVIHRDIKPDNIFLNKLFEPKVADFGLSKKIEGTIYQTESVGTPLFMAPEILNGEDYTYKVDVYAYAMLLYNFFELQEPFSYLGKLNIYKLSTDVLNGVRPPFFFDTPYNDLIIKCWDQNPDNRPTFSEIVEELETIAKNNEDIIDICEYEDYKEKLSNTKSSPHRSKDSRTTHKKPKGQQTIIQKLKEAAKNRNVASQIELANRYQKGEGVTQDLEKANNYFMMAAKNGDVGAMIKYGICLQEGIGMSSPDLEKAAEYFKKAIDKSEGKNENAMYYYALLLLEGKGVDKDEDEGIAYIKKDADLHQASAQNKYGMMLEFGTNGVKKNIKKAIKYYKYSADHGNEIGMFNYADVLEKGKYVEKNLEEAARLFRLSYKRGYAPAICRYGEMLLEGKGVKEDVDEARRLFLLAINNNYTAAYVSLGQMYLIGKGFDKNEEEATRLFKIAADAGNVRGMIQYGISLEEGIGCPKNVVKALDLYKKSIALGSNIALTKAAKLLLIGEDGVEENMETAIDYLTKAKENGDEEAASILEELNDDS